MSFRRAGWIAAASIAFAFPVRAEDLDTQACMACHQEDARPVDLKTFESSVHAKVSCVECHGDVQDIPHKKKLKKVTCAVCHGEAAEAFGRSVHKELARKEVPDTPTCAACHGTHDILPRSDVRSKVHHLKVAATCLKCHASLDITGRHPDMPTPEFAGHYEGSVHGRAVQFKGLTVAATCSDCHGHHDMRPKGDKASSVHPSRIPDTCKACHVGIFEGWKESAHGKLWAEGSGKAPVCTTCHSAHEIGDPVAAAFRIRTPDKCGGCHKEESASYHDTFHGKATSLGFVVTATCSDCHTPHMNLPKEDPRSSIHPGHLAQTCGRCHPGADASFVRYNPHLDPRSAAQSPAAHAVHLAMIWLLTGTFGFFGIHTALWLQRSVVAMLRKEFPREETDGQHVRRFSPLMVWLHVTVVVSFLTLVATGIPLRYHAAGWAQPIVTLFGGIEVTRFFHRVCAVLTFGYFAVHILFLLRRTLQRGGLRLFFGADSLVPRPKDVADLLANLKWFLYLGKPPQYGRWTYFEKFDYFAVFWGVPVIGFSGLMLWFPKFFTRFLPGDVLNLAAIIHGEEALLAGGFIFIFHFFHNHLRPENFPMDPSIFTGRVPLERFKKERPEHYAALAASNGLDALIVGPPDPRTLLLSRIFGFAAVAAGLVLATAVLAAYLSSPP